MGRRGGDRGGDSPAMGVGQDTSAAPEAPRREPRTLPVFRETNRSILVGTDDFAAIPR